MPDEVLPDKLQVFLCHSSGDKEEVRALYRHLKAENWIHPWLDEQELIPGQRWREEIEKAIEKSHAILVCLSPTSINKEGFIQREIRVALDYADYMPEGRIYIIPLKLHECEVPNRLKEWHWVNIYEKDGYEKLLKALRTRAAQMQTNTLSLAVHQKPQSEFDSIRVTANKSGSFDFSNKLWAIVAATIAVLIITTTILLANLTSNTNKPIESNLGSSTLPGGQSTSIPVTTNQTTSQAIPTATNITTIELTNLISSTTAIVKTTTFTLGVTNPVTTLVLPTTTAPTTTQLVTTPVTTNKTVPPTETTMLTTPTIPSTVASWKFNDPGIERVWNRVDKPVTLGQTQRVFAWGPAPISPLSTEPYNDKNRIIQYFDKGRMEVNSPGVNTTGAFYVTNGLLVRELLLGIRQDGDNTFTTLKPCTIPLTGDQLNNIAPSYATFRKVATLNYTENNMSAAIGSVVNTKIDNSGITHTINPSQERKIVEYDSNTKHNIPDIFVDFMNLKGPVQLNGVLMKDQTVFADATYLNDPKLFFGSPITEPYWIQVTIDGIQKDMLVQLFERRVLTYTPDNPKGYQVEMTNLGQHYYKWRYADNKGS